MPNFFAFQAGTYTWAMFIWRDYNPRIITLFISILNDYDPWFYIAIIVLVHIYYEIIIPCERMYYNPMEMNEKSNCNTIHGIINL